MQEEIIEKEEKEFNEKNKNSEEKKGNSMDFDINGVTQFYLTEEIMDKRKMQSLLADIKNRKSKMKKYNEKDMDNMKVDIDFNAEDNNLLFTPSFYNRNGSIFDENNMGSILPKSRADTTENFPINNRKSIDAINSNKDILKNNVLFGDTNINDDNDNIKIIREHNDGRKTITPFNFVKIFNRVSFVKDADEGGDFISLPYETAIQLLKQIQKYKSPFEKMLIFASLGNEIKNCIDDFWKDMEDYIKPDLLGVEAEQLMTIFIYIISKAQIKDIVVHCKLIKLFTTSIDFTTIM